MMEFLLGVCLGMFVMSLFDRLALSRVSSASAEAVKESAKVIAYNTDALRNLSAAIKSSNSNPPEQVKH